MKDRKTWTDHASLGELARVWLEKSILDTSHEYGSSEGNTSAACAN